MSSQALLKPIVVEAHLRILLACPWPWLVVFGMHHVQHLLLGRTVCRNGYMYTCPTALWFVRFVAAAVSESERLPFTHCKGRAFQQAKIMLQLKLSSSRCSPT